MSASGRGISTDEREELGRLRRENRVLREEREILKKRAAFFVKESDQTRQSPSGSCHGEGESQGGGDVQGARRLAREVLCVGGSGALRPSAAGRVAERERSA